jgi:FkbM family methyltransferase
VNRVGSATLALLHELHGAQRITIGFASRLQLGVDLVALRVARLLGHPLSNTPRVIVLSDGHLLSYRLNRGDIQSLREVWIDEVYRPPFSIRPDVIVDLGANIGLTTRWMHHHLGARQIVAVEPADDNNKLLERNVPVGTQVVRAAVGPSDGMARFATDAASNLGRVADVGEEVCQVSMQTVLELLPEGRRVDLLKLDIEGGEQVLLTTGDLRWLNRVDAIIAEFHPHAVDYEELVHILVRHGFEYIPSGSAWAGSMDAFIRRP